MRGKLCGLYGTRAGDCGGEELCRSYFNMGYETIVLRLDHLYGEPLTGAEARDICARMSVEGLETGEIRVNPHNRVALLHYSDAVEFLYAVITAKKMTYGVYQISSGETISVRSAAELVATEPGRCESRRGHRKRADGAGFVQPEICGGVWDTHCT